MQAAETPAGAGTHPRRPVYVWLPQVTDKAALDALAVRGDPRMSVR